MRSTLFALRAIYCVKLILILSLFCAGISLHAQHVQPQPKVNIRVSKQFDNNGNLVRFDSVYTWSQGTGNMPAHEVKMPQVYSFPQIYTDSLWRSLLKPGQLFFIDRHTWQRMQKMQETQKRLPKQYPKQQLYHAPGGKKAVAKAKSTLTI